MLLPKQFPYRHPKRPRNFLDAINGNAVLCAFHWPDIGPMQTGRGGEFVLGPAAFRAQFPYPFG